MKSPRKVLITTGAGTHRHEIASYEHALRDAGIERYNHTEVTSITPRNTELASHRDLESNYKPGDIVPSVISRESTDTSNQIEAAVALTLSNEKHGYIIEQQGKGNQSHDSEQTARNIAKELTTQKDYALHSKHIQRKGKPDTWTTVIAAAVLI